MEQERIKELIDIMDEKGLTKLHIKEDGVEICLERQQPQVVMAASNVPGYSESKTATQQHDLAEGEEKEASTEKPSCHHIESPMVGTFYNAASPDSDPFVKVGDVVEENTVVGIVEAMKVMNEIKAGVSGTVDELLVESGHPVEFGTKIFRII
ncbi:MAG: acetyl-CoA carboxylase biotin carboxyl carrier protein [Waddliaceae bacterium]|nr:acetyl-CoA carboxylase biotin carboxyl carrier protein [Waddliaceae bacterium]MBT3579263.1 acetyl-CoA carboxylase biotin carboxyl carrier protein [Waddliaceae bacterium]MBT4445300.1 acetyl-CoA carboxylase biotin carboxyl carrier protein [Waddliaceae bacterium]MBT6928468.1 acetyl-CoA carboxylase biotin carboxyl carrier protein [Waddliaceae bacterium]MBT7264114.1 acetyl-CoA carboxylase biotin carboxyl carrier protein [Waddliaceae bacterium]